MTADRFQIPDAHRREIPLHGEPPMPLDHLLAAARGDEPADLVFRGGHVVNVFSGEIEETEVAVTGETIVGVGDGYVGRTTIELDGAYLLPGLIDGHLHIESSMVTPYEFARAVVPRGTTTVVSDPHEIANVHGLDGIRYMLDASEGIPLTVYVMASSCVPATAMGTAGATLDVDALASLLGHPRVLGLAEVMNFPGVIHGDPEVAAKIEAFQGRPIDGHAPGVCGKAVNAYRLGGPASDHESTTAEEAREKLRRGFFLLLREATNARNLLDLLPALDPPSLRRAGLCTDDRQPADLLDVGGIDQMVRMVIESGVDPVEAIRMATLNTSEYFGLKDRGAIGPGYRADLVVAADLSRLEAAAVYVGGREVARGGRMSDEPNRIEVTPPSPSMHVGWSAVNLGIASRTGLARVIEAIPNQIVTGHLQVEPTCRDGQVVADPSRDLLKIAVLERHTGSGRSAVGLVKGIGLREGAIAGTVAHDHHNLIAIGADDASMIAAARRVAECGGGLAVARNGVSTAHLPLPIGGLMSDRRIEDVRSDFDRVLERTRELGSPLHDPFMAMSFLGLEVIPSLKITDLGYIDVDRFEPVSFWVDTEAG